MNYKPLLPEVIAEAHERIKPYIHRTPILSSSLLNEWLGHEIYFKVEGIQKIGAFKIRGALNALLKLKEQNKLPERIIALSSGNHAQAVALAAKVTGAEATIYIPNFASKIKRQATEMYGAKVRLVNTRQEAEAKIAELAGQGEYILHPYDDDDIIAGQGTSCYEALQDLDGIDAIFATCGGGGWLSGSFLAKKLLSPQTKIFAGEPELGNDAAKSYKKGRIVSLDDSPKTIADGARTLSVAERTFHYLKQLDGFYEASEDRIIYWTQWLFNLLKTTVEPTSAVSMEAAYQWLKTQDKPQRVLILLSGGNISAETHKQIWERDMLKEVPYI